MAVFKKKNFWTYALFVLIGYALGSVLGELLGGLEAFRWLGYGYTFALGPVSFDIGFLAMNLALTFRITVSSSIGLILALLIHRYL